MHKILAYFRKRRYPIAIATLCLFFVGAAMADILYTAAGDGYSVDRFGLILGKNAPTKNVVTNLGGTSGTQVSPFIDPDGEPMVAVSQYTGGADTIWIYNTSDPKNKSSWTKPVKELGPANGTITNVRGMAAAGKYLYMVGYDSAQVCVCDMTDNYKVVSTYMNTADSKTWHGEAIVSYKGDVYALFTTTSNAWDPSSGYGKSMLVKFAKGDTTLTPEKTLSLNCTNVDGGGVHGAVQLDGSTLYIASIGGYQHYDGTPNGDSMIEAVDLDNFTSKVLVKNSDLYDENTQLSAKYPAVGAWTTDFRAITITQSGDVYVASGGWGSPNRELIFKTDLDKLNNGDLGELVHTFSWSTAFIPFSIGYDDENKLLWTNGAEGDSDYNGSVFSSSDGGQTWTKYDDTALGGNVAAWNVLASTNTESGETTAKSVEEIAIYRHDRGNIYDNINLKPSETVDLDPDVSPEGATNKAVRWKSSNTSVATVNSAGVVTGVAAGNATITAVAADGSGIEDDVTVVVTQPVTKIDITGDTNIFKGATTQLTAAVTPSNASDKTVTWKSSNDSIATVSATGLVTAVKTGTVVITATAKDGSGVKGAVNVTVSVLVSAISISGETAVFEGGKTTLTASVTPEDAANKSVTWSSSNADIASVNAAGEVTGVKAGTATITATAKDGSGIKATREITVKPVLVSEIKLSGADNVIEGSSTTLSAAILPSNATDKSVTWSSSNTAVATVNTSGVVTGVKVGTATITATAKDGSGIKGTKTITVKPVLVTSITISGVSGVLKDQTITLSVAVQPTNATDKSVTWSSSNAAVATVNASGVVKGVKAGTVTITAAAKDGSGKKATKVITVNPVFVTAISITGSDNVPEKSSVTLTANITPSSASDKDVAWTSSNAAVATVSASGVVTGVKTGTATITATAKDGSGIKGTKVITVKPILITSITLSGAASVVEGGSTTLSAAILPANATDKSVTWISSNAAVATVSASGVVTGVKAGTATITATAKDGSNITGTTTVTVTEKVTTGDTSVTTPVLPTLPTGITAIAEKAITALGLDDASLAKAGITASTATAKNGSVYLNDAIVQSAAAGCGVSYDSVASMPIFKVEDANVKAGGIVAVAFETAGAKFGSITSADKAKVLAVSVNGTGKLLTYVSSAANAADNTFTIMDDAGSIVSTIDPSKTYRIVAFIADNGTLDLDSDEGTVVSSLAVLSVKSSDVTSKDVTSKDTRSGSGGGGCNVGFGMLALLMLPGLYQMEKRKTK